MRPSGSSLSLATPCHSLSRSVSLTYVPCGRDGIVEGRRAVMPQAEVDLFQLIIRFLIEVLEEFMTL